MNDKSDLSVSQVSLVHMSHFHTDHIEGLRPTWNLGIIYCSPITRKLLLHRFYFDPARVVWALWLHVEYADSFHIHYACRLSTGHGTEQ